MCIWEANQENTNFKKIFLLQCIGMLLDLDTTKYLAQLSFEF